jgi:hypothetical protein
MLTNGLVKLFIFQILNLSLFTKILQILTPVYQNIKY